MLRRLWSRLAGSSEPAPASAHARDLNDIASMRRTLRAALDRHPDTRAKLRHLAIFEKEFRRRGSQAFDRLPAAFLHRVNQQLAGIGRDEELLPFRREIEHALARRSASEDASSTAFTSLVEVDEDGSDAAWLEFQRLSSDEEAAGAAVDNIACPSSPTPSLVPSSSASTRRQHTN
jgi:hypothetical protein